MKTKHTQGEKLTKSGGVKKEINEKGYIIITYTYSFLFGLLKPQKQFLATEECPYGYWNWRKLPNLELIGDRASFQLDSWCKYFND